MNVLIAMDSWKGSLSAKEACAAVQAGLAGMQTRCIPMSDGGEGWISCLGCDEVSVPTFDAFDLPMVGKIGWLGNCAVIETAVASGLTHIPEDLRNPETTTTYGTGILLHAAMDAGAKEILVGFGGSATTDGGMGALQALGLQFFDREGVRLGRGGRQMRHIHHAETSFLYQDLDQVKFQFACDVDTTYLDAARVFGPQKGADEESISRLTDGLQKLAMCLQDTFGKPFSDVPGTGAAGGLCGGLYAVCNAEITDGFSILREVTHFDEAMAWADCVITGEGKTDSQTVLGKLPYRIGKLAQEHKIPAILISGCVEDAEGLRTHGFSALHATKTAEMSIPYAMEHASTLLTAKVAEIAHEIMS